jgi:ubiquinone/menaquinone biosynthesis C-methylase UbiE
MMLPYQNDAVEKIVGFLSTGDNLKVLEIGSDISGLVSSAIAKRTGACVVGINPISDFPQNYPVLREESVSLIRGDGRYLPFADNSFDGIFSIATMEHVNGLGLFLNEVNRVLKPKGFFYAKFGPLWSCAIGHHVYAVSGGGDKEVRFWKAGRNPVPDYAHLYMKDDELRRYLDEGPCSKDLINPIIEWIYHGDSINRCHFEEYVNEFKKSSLLIQQLITKSLSDKYPKDKIKFRLTEKYGGKMNFSNSTITVMLRKADPRDGFIKSNFFVGLIYLKYISYLILFNSGFQLLKRFPELKFVARKIIKLLP